MDGYELEKIQIDYAKSSSQFFMLVAGGQITLLGSIFKDYDGKGVALIAIALMLMASIWALVVLETIVRKISPKPTFEKRITRRFFSIFSRTIEAVYVKSAIAGVFATLSLIFYTYFITDTMWP